jgi:hypothetical protein
LSFSNAASNFGLKLRIRSYFHRLEHSMSLKDPNVSNPNASKRVAIVVANPAISTTTGWPVGFWWSELSHPYWAFEEAGYEIEIFSPEGGRCEVDAMSDPNDASGYSKWT